MPNFLSSTVISRHDARLSSTTHCALRASRITYNLTNLSRCYSFLLSIWTYAAPCRTAHFPSNSFQCSLVILQALSHSLAKVTKPLTQPNHKSHMQRNCNILSHAAPALSPIFHAYHYCQEPYRPHICQIYHTAMGHRYFNLAMTSDICLRYAHAAEESAFASRSPIPRDDRGTLS